MKSTPALWLFVLAVTAVFGYVVWQDRLQIRSLEARIDGLTKKAPDTRVENLALQEKCASRADVNFQKWGYKPDGADLSTFTAHYNQRLNKCFMAVVTTTVTKGHFTTFKQLFDAFEMKTYGEVSNLNGKDVWCHVIVDGIQQPCKPGEDWADLVKIYMEG